jgi:hypothetical protein
MVVGLFSGYITLAVVGVVWFFAIRPVLRSIRLAPAPMTRASLRAARRGAHRPS